MSAIHAQDVSFRYETGRPLVDRLSLEIPGGQFVSLLGSSGSGKSTLLRLFAGLLDPASGSLRKETTAVSFVFQDPRLLPWRTVLENVELPLELGGRQASVAAGDLLRQVGMWESRGLFPHELSGGMKQRVAIARALVTDPKILFLDEPFSALDEVIRESLQDLVLELWRKRGMTTLFVTHSISEAVFLSQRVLLLAKGRFAHDEILPADWERTSDLRARPDFHRKVAELSGLLRKSGGAA